MIILLFASLFGFYFPKAVIYFHGSKADNAAPILSLLNAFATGAIIGVALLHLLADAIDIDVVE